MKNGFIQVAAATPRVTPASPTENLQRMLELAKDADRLGVRVLVFPELSLVGATSADLLTYPTLQNGALDALRSYCKETRKLSLLSILGLPVAVGDRLFSCAAVTLGGRLLGLVPKAVLPYGQSRQLFPAPDETDEITLPGFDYSIPFGTQLLFCCEEMPALRIGVELGEDLVSLYPLSSAHAAAGATLICNPAASPEGVGAAEYRTLLVRAQSARALCGYVLSSAGDGESTTDAVYGGHALLCENGALLAERKPLCGERLTVTEIDLERIVADRRRSNVFLSDAADYTVVPFSLPLKDATLTRRIAPLPFVPADPEERAARCQSILETQAEGLAVRLSRAGARKAVIGISGGLDSTLALLVTDRAMKKLGRPATDILAVTMPCFGTTARTRTNATLLCEELGTEFRTVDIFDAVNQHFADIGHDPANRDVTYENAQARERTQILMDLANATGGMVIGTGDLSELALGWATYNGDHMSMYGVNAGVPKTLVRHLVAYCAAQAEKEGQSTLSAALRDVLATPVSPELLPADDEGNIAQKTEDLVGPYEIHDFYLYYMLRYGFSPAKLYRMARYALGELYSAEELLKWLKVFLRRFFTQQFKRSCLPDGPKVGSVGISPRTDWAMPSDAASTLWLAEAEALSANG